MRALVGVAFIWGAFAFRPITQALQVFGVPHLGVPHLRTRNRFSLSLEVLWWHKGRMTKLCDPHDPPEPEAPVRVVDCIGLRCPLPVLKARKALRQVRRGDLVQVDSTDPMAVVDVPAMARDDGHVVERIDRDGEIARFFIRRGPV